MKRLLIAIAAILELVAAAGIEALSLGSIHVGLVPLGLCAFFVAALLP